MGLVDYGATLPPGFRFYPRDDELVCHYLQMKVTNQQVSKSSLVDIDLHICEPWQLPEAAKLNSSEWYFFSFRDRKYATGFRANRATTSGYWKATGKDKEVLDPKSQALVGMRKTLVFYKNRAPNGIKTGWIMHEFRLENPNTPPKEDWVLCRVFDKSRSINTNIFDCPPSGFSYHGTEASGERKIEQGNEYLKVSEGHNKPSSSNILANLQSEDEFGFLDLSFHESNVKDILPSGLETNDFDQYGDSMFS